MAYKDSEKKKENNKKWYARHRAEVIARSAKWNKTNRDKRKVISQKDNDKRKDVKIKWHRDRYFGGLYEVVMERDNHQCTNCGTEEKIMIHHIDQDKRNNTLENLIVLCISCHPKIHGRERGGLNYANCA